MAIYILAWKKLSGTAIVYQLTIHTHQHENKKVKRWRYDTFDDSYLDRPDHDEADYLVHWSTDPSYMYLYFHLAPSGLLGVCNRLICQSIKIDTNQNQLTTINLLILEIDETASVT